MAKMNKTKGYGIWEEHCKCHVCGDMQAHKCMWDPKRMITARQCKKCADPHRPVVQRAALKTQLREENPDVAPERWEDDNVRCSI